MCDLWRGQVRLFVPKTQSVLPATRAHHVTRATATGFLMRQLAVMLVVTHEILVAEVITRTIITGLTDTVLLTATSEQEALEHARTQPLALAILDLDLVERRAGAELYRTLRAQYPALPLLVCSAGDDIEALYATFGYNRVVSLAELVAYPEHLLSHVREALEPAALQRSHSLPDQREAAPLRVLVLCRHLLARSALTHALSRLGIVVRAAAEDPEGFMGVTSTSGDVQLLVGLGSVR
jgi:CheY-like chemotaxis protein